MLIFLLYEIVIKSTILKRIAFLSRFVFSLTFVLALVLPSFSIHFIQFSVHSRIFFNRLEMVKKSNLDGSNNCCATGSLYLLLLHSSFQWMVLVDIFYTGYMAWCGVVFFFYSFVLSFSFSFIFIALYLQVLVPHFNWIEDACFWYIINRTYRRHARKIWVHFEKFKELDLTHAHTHTFSRTNIRQKT